MMTRRYVLSLTAMVVAAALLFGGCKKIYFRIVEEPSGKPPLRFQVDKANFEPKRDIFLSEGKYSIVLGQSTILFIEGTASTTGYGEVGVATMDYKQTARFFMTLPLEPTAGRYTITPNSLCELIGGGDPGTGNSLFMGNTGEIVIDSVKHGRIYGAFDGNFINAAGRTVTVTGPIKAGRK